MNKTKVILLNILESEEFISEENLEKTYNEVVKKMSNRVYRTYGKDIIFVNDLKIHEDPRRLSDIKIAIYDRDNSGKLEAVVYN